MTTRVGFIGLGTMGRALATRLIHAGNEVSVWNRTPGRAKGLVELGALDLTTPADIFAGADVVCSMLADDEAVDATFNAPTLAAAQGSLHVNMSTISPAASRILAARHTSADVGYLAAPVLGRPEVAVAGQLNIVAAGSAEHLDRARPVLQHFGKRIWHVGDDPAQANLVKIGVNYTLIHALQALGESLTLVARGGVDARQFVELLTDTSFTGSAYTGYGHLIAEQEYYPAAFSVALGLKDLTLARNAADELGAALPAEPVLRELFTAALNDPELAEGDWSIIAEIIRQRGARSTPHATEALR